MTRRASSRISLCMIVRDEEAALPSCLEAAAPFVDEIVVVDTGSRDRTREIAAARGANVLRLPWDDDFAAARNASLEAATGDWILVLDADERMTEAAGRELRAAAARDDVFGCFLPIENRYGDGPPLTALIFRAWRRRPEVRFRGRIHEQVLWAAGPLARSEGRRLVKLEGATLHDGYRPEIVAEKNKNERNLRLFERALAEDPSDLYLTWRFAEFLRRFPDRRSDVRALLERGVAAVDALAESDVRDLPFAGELYAQLSQNARERGDLAEARALAERGMLRAEITPNLRFAAAAAALDGGRADVAADGFRACLAEHGKVALIPGQPGVTGAMSRRGLARALRDAGRHDEARLAFEAAWNDDPLRDDVAQGWLEATVRAGRTSDGMRTLVARLKARPQDALAWRVGAELLGVAGMAQDSLRWWLRAAAALGEAGDDAGRASALGGAAAAALRAGDYESALALAAEGRAAPAAQAAAVALAAFAGAPSPEWADATDAAVRVAFRRLVSVLRADPACEEFTEALRAADLDPPCFDPR
ncbi:MAG TPA: glycosyltransferase family 2 protein, partial [Planctomycetota bacterium]|nr:glycosyltransferase family 2 protein [Planctomycetota bacterium]